MLWDAAVMANRVRRIPAVDRTLRRGAAAAADRFADTLDGITPSVGRSAKASPDDAHRQERGRRGRTRSGSERGRR
jgi:hypothetical protein